MVRKAGFVVFTGLGRDDNSSLVVMCVVTSPWFQFVKTCTFKSVASSRPVYFFLCPVVAFNLSV